MPIASEYYIYGGLSNEQTTISAPTEFLMGRKQLKGIWLSYQIHFLDKSKIKKYLD